MNMKQDLAALAQELDHQGLWTAPDLRECALKVEIEKLDQPTQVVNWLKDFQSRHEAVGWVETTEQVRLLMSTQDWPSGVVLNAELSAGDVSVHVRQLDGHWCCTKLTESDGLSHWVSEKELASAEKGASSFVYRVYSQIDSQGVLVEVAARLADVRVAG